MAEIVSMDLKIVVTNTSRLTDHVADQNSVYGIVLQLSHPPSLRIPSPVMRWSFIMHPVTTMTLWCLLGSVEVLKIILPECICGEGMYVTRRMGRVVDNRCEEGRLECLSASALRDLEKRCCSSRSL